MSTMGWHAVIANVVTTLAFVAFVGIVVWAWSGRQRRRFEEAARAPFALPDEVEDNVERHR